MTYAMLTVIIGCVLLCWMVLRNRMVESSGNWAATVETAELPETRGDLDSCIKLFQECRESDPWTARLVMRNALTRFPGNSEIFTTYLDYLLSIAKENDEIEYLEEARSILMEFAEYSALEVFPEIIAYRDQIHKLQEIFYAKALELRGKANDEVLDQLQRHLEELKELDSGESAQALLESAVQTEENLDVKNLSPGQVGLYEKLKKEFSEVAEALGNSMLSEKHRHYNIDAVKRIKVVFDDFKKNERDYVKQKRVMSDLAEKLATINPQYLTTETLTYFNYVYGYIFSKIKDEEKFSLTELMTLSKKDLVR